MDNSFWSRCVEARCVVVPMAAYSQFGADGNLHREHFIGIKFAALPFEGEPAGPDYYFGIEEHWAGLDGLYDSPQEALAARQAELGIATGAPAWPEPLEPKPEPVAWADDEALFGDERGTCVTAVAREAMQRGSRASKRKAARLRHPLYVPRLALEFLPQSLKPTEEGDYLLYNQCDGFHLAEAWFEDGKFVHFYGWPHEPYGEDCYVAWAKLPDTVKDLYERFADKPRDGLSAREVTLQRLAGQATTQARLGVQVGGHPDVALLRTMLEEYMNCATDYIINAEQAASFDRDKLQAAAALDRIEAALRGTKP